MFESVIMTMQYFSSPRFEALRFYGMEKAVLARVPARFTPLIEPLLYRNVDCNRLKSEVEKSSPSDVAKLIKHWPEARFYVAELLCDPALRLKALAVLKELKIHDGNLTSLAKIATAATKKARNSIDHAFGDGSSFNQTIHFIHELASVFDWKIESPNGSGIRKTSV